MCARLFLGFPLYHPLDEKRRLSKASTAIENQTFGAGVTKNILYIIEQNITQNVIYRISLNEK